MPPDRNFWTGVLVLGSAGAGALAFSLAAANQFQPYAARYIVEADQLAGAGDGTPVEMAGYELGRVEDVQVLPSPRLHFALTIAVRSDVPIPSGTAVVIATRSLAGGVVLRLVPPAEAAENLPPGGRLVATPELTLADVLATADRTLENIEVITTEFRAVLVDGSPGASGDGVGATVLKLNRTLDDTHATLAATDQFLRTLDQTAKRTGPAVDRDLRQLETTLASADRLAGNIDRFVEDDGRLDLLLGDVAVTLANLDRAARAVAAFDPNGDTEIGHTIDQLDRATASLDRFMAAFEKKPLQTLSKGVPEASVEPAAEPVGPTPDSAAEPLRPDPE